jgi:hypothetical protein
MNEIDKLSILEIVNSVDEIKLDIFGPFTEN